jgi:uncharacterized protein YjbJ (UPF0337 family)
MEEHMDWNRIEGNWKQFKGKAKEKWGRLTDDELDVINGRQDQLEGKVQERYGLAKDQAKKDVDTWSRPHFSLALPLNCFQFPSMRFQSMCSSMLILIL